MSTKPPPAEQLEEVWDDYIRLIYRIDGRTHAAYNANDLDTLRWIQRRVARIVADLQRREGTG